MDLIKTTFGNTKLNKDNLISYGFKDDFGILTYSKQLIDNLEIRISYDDLLILKVWDTELDEEYIGYKYIGKGPYGSLVESEIEKILIDIKDYCNDGIKFHFAQTIRIDEYMSSVYGKAEHPFSSYPNICAYKESGNDKWYALVMNIPFKKIDPNKENVEIEIINLKVDKNKIKSLIKKDGIYPAYHMNKSNWVSVVLDDTLSDVDIILMINDSYDLVLNAINNKKFYRRKYWNEQVFTCSFHLL